MPNVAKITLDNKKVKLEDVLKALEKAGYPGKKAEAAQEKKEEAG